MTDYQSFIKRMAAAAVAGGAGYLAAKYSGRGLDVAVIAASAQIAVDEVNDITKRVHVRDEGDHDDLNSAVVKADEPTEPPAVSEPETEPRTPGRKSRAMGLR